MDNTNPSESTTKKTRWGCLTLLIIPTLIFAAAHLHDMWWEQQPLPVHLRIIFKESGFSVPEYVSDISGWKGDMSFQGDLAAYVSFTVRPSDIEGFTRLPTPPWNNPAAFQPLDKVGDCGDFKVPAGSLMIEEWEQGPKTYMCKYAVDRAANRVYFYRATW
jgi:hypothetical protein